MNYPHGLSSADMRHIEGVVDEKRLDGLLSHLNAVRHAGADVVTVRVTLRRDLVDELGAIAAEACTPLEVILETFAEVGLLSHKQMRANRAELDS